MIAPIRRGIKTGVFIASTVLAYEVADVLLRESTYKILEEIEWVRDVVKSAFSPTPDAI